MVNNFHGTSTEQVFRVNTGWLSYFRKRTDRHRWGKLKSYQILGGSCRNWPKGLQNFPESLTVHINCANLLCIEEGYCSGRGKQGTEGHWRNCYKNFLPPATTIQTFRGIHASEGLWHFSNLSLNAIQRLFEQWTLSLLFTNQDKKITSIGRFKEVFQDSCLFVIQANIDLGTAGKGLCKKNKGY